MTSTLFKFAYHGQRPACHQGSHPVTLVAAHPPLKPVAQLPTRRRTKPAVACSSSVSPVSGITAKTRETGGGSRRAVVQHAYTTTASSASVSPPAAGPNPKAGGGWWDAVTSSAFTIVALLALCYLVFSVTLMVYHFIKANWGNLFSAFLDLIGGARVVVTAICFIYVCAFLFWEYIERSWNMPARLASRFLRKLKSEVEAIQVQLSALRLLTDEGKDGKPGEQEGLGPQGQ